MSFLWKILKLETPSQNCNCGSLQRNFLRDLFYLTIQHSIECQYKSPSKASLHVSFFLVFFLLETHLLFIYSDLIEWDFLHYRISGKGNDWIVFQVFLQFFNSVFLKVIYVSNGSLFTCNPCWKPEFPNAVYNYCTYVSI